MTLSPSREDYVRRGDGWQAIILAAGAGRRFGGGKLVAEWRGAPLVQAAVHTALSATVEGVTVVLGAGAEAVAEAVRPLSDPRLRTVVAPDWIEGMATSLVTGIKALPADTRGVVVFLADMPLIPSGLADRLLDAVDQGAPAAVVRSLLGPAHPVAFSAEVFPALLALKGDRGARSVLDGLGKAVSVLDCDDPGVTFDVDRVYDLGAGPASGPLPHC